METGPHQVMAVTLTLGGRLYPTYTDVQVLKATGSPDQGSWVRDFWFFFVSFSRTQDVIKELSNGIFFVQKRSLSENFIILNKEVVI